MSMATNTLNSITHHHHHHSHSLLKDKLSGVSPPASLAFLRPPGSAGGIHVAYSASDNAASVAQPQSSGISPAASAACSLEALERHLAAGEFREGDEETRRLIIVLAGEAAQKRGYVFFSEVQYIPVAELRAIDELWRVHSGGRFGYSVQKKIFVGPKVNRDFTSFFIRVGWMKKLDSTEVDHYNYKSFPSEFTWDISQDPPEGHLPLTNALRGTQLLNSIFFHPAFDHVVADAATPASAAPSGPAKSPFKPNYSF